MYLGVRLERTSMALLLLISGWETVLYCNIFLRLSFKTRRLLFWSWFSQPLLFFSILTKGNSPLASCSLLLSSLFVKDRTSRCMMTSTTCSEEYSPGKAHSTARKACLRDWVALPQLYASLQSKSKISSMLLDTQPFWICAHYGTAALEDIRPRARPLNLEETLPCLFLTWLFMKEIEEWIKWSEGLKWERTSFKVYPPTNSTFTLNMAFESL